MIDNSNLTLQIAGPHDQETARSVAILAEELSRRGVAVTRPMEPAPEGSKSGLVFAGGSLIMAGALSSVIARSAAQVILGFIRRGAAREITIRARDAEVTINGASRETESELTAWLLRSTSDHS